MAVTLLHASRFFLNNHSGSECAFYALSAHALDCASSNLRRIAAGNRHRALEQASSHDLDLSLHLDLGLDLNLHLD